ncbi:hypothetical protein R3P38DRAFT_3209666 [Favolaschia claudopus]|uniref:Uncharacterized protein n=1 Tax=Favolaschia claudopus TaxID=2862362 RepID=A0AAW0AI40_9AGAR
MPPKDAANWTKNPQDLPNLLAFFSEQRARIGETGNWPQTVLNEAVVKTASFGPPTKGGPKTDKAIDGKWKALRKLYDYILQVKQKTYIGASGWTFTDEGGFNVNDDNRDAWNGRTLTLNLSPIRVGRRPVTSQPQFQGDDDDDDDDNSSQSQPFSQWSQSNYGDSQPPNTDHEGASQPPVSQQAPPTVPATPSLPKRPASDDVPPPWSNKRNKITGPEAIWGLKGSVDVCHVSYQKNRRGPELAVQDADAGHISISERARLSIMFGRD